MKPAMANGVEAVGDELTKLPEGVAELIEQNNLWCSERNYFRSHMWLAETERDTARRAQREAERQRDEAEAEIEVRNALIADLNGEKDQAEAKLEAWRKWRAELLRDMEALVTATGNANALAALLKEPRSL